MPDWYKFDAIMNQITKLEATIMASIDAVNKKLDEVIETVTSEREEVRQSLSELNTTIEDLRKQIEAGSPSAEALQAVVDRLESVKGDIGKIVDRPAPTPPSDDSSSRR